MASTNFYIDKSSGHEVICTNVLYNITERHAALTNLKIEVYHLNNENFKPAKDSAVFYGLQDNLWLAFVSEYVTDLLPVVTNGMHWYAQEKGYRKMDFTINDPRPKPRMRLVK